MSKYEIWTSEDLHADGVQELRLSAHTDLVAAMNDISALRKSNPDEDYWLAKVDGDVF